MEIAHGKHAEDFPELESPLTPFGPSDILMLGIFTLSILFVYQKLKPLTKVIFSFRVKFSMILSKLDMRSF
jgi:hypothetical protein